MFRGQQMLQGGSSWGKEQWGTGTACTRAALVPNNRQLLSRHCSILGSWKAEEDPPQSVCILLLGIRFLSQDLHCSCWSWP